MSLFQILANKLISSTFKLSKGGATIKVFRNALGKLEKKYGSLTRSRIVDYVVCSAYPFRDRGDNWKVNQIFGPKSLERFTTDKGRQYYEDRWLAEENLTRAGLMKLIEDRSEHPLSKYIYVAAEESTKRGALNTELGFARCQSSTLGWSPESESCNQCDFQAKCKELTKLNYPELYRIREENGSRT